MRQQTGLFQNYKTGFTMTAIERISQIMPGAIQRASEVIPYQIAVRLSPSEMTVVKASIPSQRYPKIADLNALDVVKLARQLRKSINLRLGLNVSDDDEVEEEILAAIAVAIKKHRNLTVREIETAVDKALDGDFLSEKDTFVHFNLANFSLWIKAYIQDTKVPVMKKHSQLLHQVKDEVPPAMTNEEIKKSRIEIANMYLDAMKANAAYIIPGGATLYDGLVELGIINLSIERKKELFRNAKILNPTAGNEEVWKVEAKALAYNHFINDMLDNGFRLDEEGEFVADEEMN